MAPAWSAERRTTADMPACWRRVMQIRPRCTPRWGDEVAQFPCPGVLPIRKGMDRAILLTMPWQVFSTLNSSQITLHTSDTNREGEARVWHCGFWLKLQAASSSPVLHCADGIAAVQQRWGVCKSLGRHTWQPRLRQVTGKDAAGRTFCGSFSTYF